MKNSRIYLSPPNIDQQDFDQVKMALESGWVAPVGPAINAFEESLVRQMNEREVCVLNSGTSGLHLSLILAGIDKGDHVLVSSFNFAACANVILYQNAIPVFIDSEPFSWNMDPEVLLDYLKSCKIKPKALIVTHLYGMPAQMKRILQIANEHNLVIIEDAAEALGSKINHEQVGSLGNYGVLSFNGNKIITTSGGGALICDPLEKGRVIHLATQANKGTFGYHHTEVGYNYRMSNILASIGVGQLEKLDVFVRRKREIFEVFKDELSDCFEFLDEPDDCFSNRWLTTGLLKKENPANLIQYLNEKNIESRLLWKPLHMHPAYASHAFIGSGVCEKLFERGICLPSGTGLTEDQQAFVIDQIKAFYQS